MAYQYFIRAVIRTPAYSITTRMRVFWFCCISLRRLRVRVFPPGVLFTHCTEEFIVVACAFHAVLDEFH